MTPAESTMRRPGTPTATFAADRRGGIEFALNRALDRVAPLWPLDRFVAVNPYLGMTDLGVDEAARTLARVAGARFTLPRAFYRAAIAVGEIGDRDLLEALHESRAADRLPRDLAGLRRLLDEDAPEPVADRLPTVADLAAGLGDADLDWASFVTERISTWAAARFDEGAAIADPWRELSPWCAWRREAQVDRGPEIAGLEGFRRRAAGLSDDPIEIIEAGARRLNLGGAALELYLHRLLMSIGGWAAFARRVDREQGSSVQRDLLAIRMAWELVLLDAFPELDPAPLQEALHVDPAGEVRSSSALDLVLQAAFEKARRRGRLDDLAGGLPRPESRRASLQAAFCIDVRSEPLRRALESLDQSVETIGFAGFFGLPIAYRPLGSAAGEARCPVLLSPSIEVSEVVSPDEEAALVERRLKGRALGRLWKNFKNSAVSSFAFVETLGLGAAAGLAFGSTPRSRAADEDAQALEGRRLEGRPGRLDLAERVALAESALRGMSLTSDFAPLVLIVGHGSTSTNNLHASGLDCGACGGHAGDINARLAGSILNEGAVRAELAARGIEIPADTIFIPALHDTTGDEIRILGRRELDLRPAALDRLDSLLAAAGERARRERARRFDREEASELAARGRDWSQTRPEWGLAGCSSFIVAPRRRSRSVDLGGRAFLHSYDWRADEGFAILEQIMTAPMIVASWINLQYYASTVDNRVFGCGDKTLHNAISSLGVLEGNGGDLRVGLPLQSLNDGAKWAHEALRLDVMIEAPIAAIDSIIAKHDELGRLFDGGWLHLFAIDDGAGVIRQRVGPRRWQPVTDESATEAEAA